jgi:hypothetical protein
MEWFTRVKAIPERAAVSGEKQKAAGHNRHSWRTFITATAKGGM